MTEEFEPLVPLTDEQQADFDKRRESAAVVQNKCECGAWYETSKGPIEYDEEIFCTGCGAFMRFKVPKLDRAAVTAPIDLANPDGVMDTGMKVKDAIASASAWWAKIGRKQMKRTRQNEASPFASLDPNSENHMPSGIIHGEPWDVLTKRERLLIVKAWHHFYVRKPQKL